MTAKPNPRELDIQQWLTMLAVRCVPRKSENLELLVRDYAAGLADLPYEVFTAETREITSREFDSFPTYRQLRKFLDGWAEKNVGKAEDLKLLPPVDDPNLSDEDRAHVRSWINMHGNGKLEVRLDRYRLKWPAAFRYIVRTDADAETIARQRGWIVEDDPPIDVSERGITRNLIGAERKAGEGDFGRAIAAMLLAALRREVAARAPERLHMLPDAIVPQRQPREASDRRQDSEADRSARAQMSRVQPDAEAPAAPPERGPSLVDQRALLGSLRVNTALPNRAERIAELLVKWHGHPGFEPLATDPPLYPTPPPAPPPANDKPAKEDELWTPSWMTAAD